MRQGVGDLSPHDPEARGDSLTEGQLQGPPPHPESSTELILDRRTDGFSPHSGAWGRLLATEQPCTRREAGMEARLACSGMS